MTNDQLHKTIQAVIKYQESFSALSDCQGTTEQFERALRRRERMNRLLDEYKREFFAEGKFIEKHG